MNPKYSLRAVGLFQAAGLTAYVSIFAVAVEFMEGWIKRVGVTPSPAAAIMLFLLSFLVSALICGVIALRYPTVLFFADKKHEALKAIIWTAAWLLFFFAIFLLLGFVIFPG